MKRVSAAEILYKKRRKMPSKKTEIEKDTMGPLDERIFVIDDEKHRELVKMVND